MSLVDEDFLTAARVQARAGGFTDLPVLQLPAAFYGLKRSDTPSLAEDLLPELVEKLRPTSSRSSPVSA